MHTITIKTDTPPTLEQRQQIRNAEWANWQTIKKTFKHGAITQRVFTKGHKESFLKLSPNIGYTHEFVSFYKIADIYQIDCFGLQVCFCANQKDARTIATVIHKAAIDSGLNKDSFPIGATQPPSELTKAILPIIRSAMEMGKLETNANAFKLKKSRL